MPKILGRLRQPFANYEAFHQKSRNDETDEDSSAGFLNNSMNGPSRMEKKSHWLKSSSIERMHIIGPKPIDFFENTTTMKKRYRTLRT